MGSNTERFRGDLKKLVDEGDLLRFSLALELDILDAASKKKLEPARSKLPNFKIAYEGWYSQAMQVVKQLIPDRLTDFVKQYKDEKRKQTDFLTYGISDHMIGLRITRLADVLVDGKAAFPKFEQQLNILKSAQTRLESSLYDIIEIVQADLFDNELEAATELCKKGFARAGGALAGVVLERHLSRIGIKHSLKPKKAAPTINDLNQILKDNNIIDISMWRFIQHLGDLRNLCDHDKGKDPTKEQVTDLIDGVAKITKTLT